MRAARLHTDETTLRVVEMPDPQPRPGAAVVRLQSSFMSSSLVGLVRGEPWYVTPERPFTPGLDAVGHVEALGEGTAGLSVGDPVYCDVYVEQPRADGSGDAALAGTMALVSDAKRLLTTWRDGTLATHLELPGECFTNIEPALEKVPVDTLTRLGWLGTAHAGLEKVGLAAGESVAVIGGTGLMGSSAVLVALAMGASSVTAVGRSRERLAALVGLDPRVTVATSEELSELTFDVLVMASSDGPDLVEAALPGLKRYGRIAVLADLPRSPRFLGLLDRDITIRFSLWFPRSTPTRLVNMIASGVLDLSGIRSHAFELNQIEEALVAASQPQVPLGQVVVHC